MQNLPVKLYTAEQVREMESIVIKENDIAGIELMRRAGAAVFSVLKKCYKFNKLIVFCGSGNNAGDGYVIAKLALKSGYKVIVYSASIPKSLSGDALIAYEEYCDSGGLYDDQVDKPILTECVIVDALLGTGLNRIVSGQYSEMIELINNSTCPVISVDIPSGLNADTGSAMGSVVKADKTVSFIGLKQGLLTGVAAEYCGEILYSPLDVADEVFQRVNYAAKRIQQSYLPNRNRCAHKGHNGHVLVVGGDSGYSGATTIAAQAALRIGSGLVSVATRQIHSHFINNHQPEVMCHGVEDVTELVALIEKATVIVVGPGLGRSKWAQSIFSTLLSINKPLIIDADGLNLLAKQAIHHNNWILTPHPGEAARLLDCSTADIAEDRFAAVSKLQSKYGGVALLKGAGTLLSNGDEIFVSTTGNPGMASGGMGDLLSGMIAGLVAQKIDLMNAATMAVYLHGKAAELSAKQSGEIGMVATDLLPIIRQLINE